jgi:hypothetical protein
VQSGNLTLKAAANWSYGASTEDEMSGDAADRAIAIDEGATLTIGASDFVTTLCDPIVGEGTLVFETGSRIALGGLLRAAAMPDAGWASVATVGAVSGVPELPANCTMITEDNEDGTVSVKIRISPGTVVIIR